MSVNLSIKNASDEVVAGLKLRAKRNHRSLQGELMAIIENAATNWGAASEGDGLREIAVEWQAQGRSATAQHARGQRDDRVANEAGDADSDGRKQDIGHLMGLLKKGLPLGNRRFTRDEMHER